MPRHAKDEAQVRMAIGAARVLMREGKTAEEGLKAMKQHLANMVSLDQLKPSSDESDAETSVALRNFD